MGTELAVLEPQLNALAPHYEQALAGVMPVQRFLRTAMIAFERTPKLLQCTQQSIFNAIMSAGVLGLELDGVTGQAFPIPFADTAQLVIGYKGYNTLAARSGITISGSVVRKGDNFDFDIGEGWVKHRPQGGTGEIIGAWAKSAANDRPSVVSWLAMPDIMAIKAKSPGARKKDGPWNDTAIGFPAMAEKSAKRRLARSMPLNIMQLAAGMEEAFEERKQLAYITPDRNIVTTPIDTRTGGQPGMGEILERPKPMSDLLKLAREKAFQGQDVVTAWWGTLEKHQQYELKPHLPDLRAIAADPEKFMHDEGREGAEGGASPLAAWWENLAPEWKEKLERFYTEELLPAAAAADNN